MRVQATVLINTEPGKAKEVAGALQAQTHEAKAVFGPYDVIARVAAPSVKGLDEMLRRDIEQLEGVRKVSVQLHTSAPAVFRLFHWVSVLTVVITFFTFLGGLVGVIGLPPLVAALLPIAGIILFITARLDFSDWRKSIKD